MLKTILISLGMTIAMGESIAYSQSNARFLQEEAKPWEGTFQIIISDERLIQPEITASLLQQIEDKRDQQNIVMWDYTPYIAIKILPYNEIESENFEPLKTYSYVE